MGSDTTSPTGESESDMYLPFRARLGRHRWVVERTLAWLNLFRQLTIPYERRGDMYQDFLSLGCALLCWQALNRRRS